MNRPDFPSVVDASMIKEFRACRQKFFLKDMRHWKPQESSIHLHAGACFAKGLEEARHKFYEQGNSPEDALMYGIKALIVAWGSYEAPEGAAKSLERMCGALEFYFSEWPMTHEKGAHPKLMPSGRRAIEFSFAQPIPNFLHPITNEPLIYSGRSDMICDFAGGTYVEDDKTASQLGESWVRQWELRSQFTGYCWAARESGINVNGVLVRGVSILKTKYGAAEAITYRFGWEIARWYEQLVRDLRAMQRAWEEGYWDWNLGESCSSYGGCEFVSVCKSNEPELWLPVYFERRRWDPLERTETELGDE